MNNPYTIQRRPSSPSHRGSATQTKAMVDKLARRYARKFKRAYGLDPAPARSRVIGMTSSAPASEAGDPES